MSEFKLEPCGLRTQLWVIGSKVFFFLNEKQILVKFQRESLHDFLLKIGEAHNEVYESKRHKLNQVWPNWMHPWDKQDEGNYSHP